MGMLSQLKPSAAAQNLFNTSGQGGSTNAMTQAMDFVNRHPALMQAVSIMFPPARAAVQASVLASKLNKTLSSGANLQEVTSGFRQTQAPAGLEPAPLTERLSALADQVSSAPVIQRRSNAQR